MINIFDELSYAKKLLICGVDKSMYNFDLSVIAKYQRHIGKNEDEVRSELENFCITFEDSFNSVIHCKRLDDIVKNTKNNGLRIPKDVSITRNELNIINKLENYKDKKILFAMLVLAKYYKITDTRINKRSNDKNEYHINSSFISIMKHAHVYLNKEDRKLFKMRLFQMGLIEGTLYGYKILFANVLDNSEIVLVVTDMNNLISFLPFYCKDCGEVVEKKYKHGRCLKCYKEYKRKLTRLRVKRFRDKNNNM